MFSVIKKLRLSYCSHWKMIKQLIIYTYCYALLSSSNSSIILKELFILQKLCSLILKCVLSEFCASPVKVAHIICIILTFITWFVYFIICSHIYTACSTRKKSLAALIIPQSIRSPVQGSADHLVRVGPRTDWFPAVDPWSCDWLLTLSVEKACSVTELQS